jgi:predicted nucleic acid-binding protein
MKLLDTCFLIHLQKEWARSESGPASAFLERPTDDEFAISAVTVLAFLEGYNNVRDGERFLDPFRQLDITASVARVGSQIRRSLRTRGEMIGDFDILIAATALSNSLTLVTDNTRHFERIEGLSLEPYR